MLLLKPLLAAAVAISVASPALAQDASSSPGAQPQNRQLMIAYQDRQERYRPQADATAEVDLTVPAPAAVRQAAPGRRDPSLEAYDYVRSNYDAQYGQGAWARRYGFHAGHNGE